MDTRSGRLDNSLMISHSNKGSVSKSPLRSHKKNDSLMQGSTHKSQALNLTSVFIQGAEDDLDEDGKRRKSQMPEQRAMSVS